MDIPTTQSVGMIERDPTYDLTGLDAPNPADYFDPGEPQVPTVGAPPPPPKSVMSTQEQQDLIKRGKSELDKATQVESEGIAKTEPMYQDLAKQLEQPMPGIPARDSFHYAMSASPLLAAITVLGGAAFRMHGLPMLGALTGMVQGAQKGDEQAFEDAQKKYQEQMNQAREYMSRKATLLQLYQEHYKDLADGHLKAFQMTKELLQEGSAIDNKEFQQWATATRLWDQLQTLHDRQFNANRAYDEKVREFNAKASGVTKAALKAGQYADAAVALSKRIDSLITRVKEQNKKGTSVFGTAGSFNRGGEKITGEFDKSANADVTALFNDYNGLAGDIVEFRKSTQKMGKDEREKLYKSMGMTADDEGLMEEIFTMGGMISSQSDPAVLKSLEALRDKFAKAGEGSSGGFIEGKVYTDANGNSAMYTNGQWIPQKKTPKNQ